MRSRFADDQLVHDAATGSALLQRMTIVKIALKCALAATLVVACSSNKPFQVELMPAPAMYGDGEVNPFQDNSAIADGLPDGIFYATTRKPSPPDARERDKFYGQERSWVMRLGLAKIKLGETDITSWEEAQRISLLKARTTDYPLQVWGVEEFGVLDTSVNGFSAEEFIDTKSRQPAERFAGLINEHLEKTPVKDVFVYVHGFRTNFQSPQLVAAELWHFMGYNGVFISYTWPATMSRLDYVGNAETAVWAAPFLRVLLEFLAADTNAERIHVIGYSAGTRVVASAAEQMTLLHSHKTDEQIRADTRLGHVILVGSDVDRGLAATYLAAGMLRIPQHFTVYLSQSDSALGLARWLYKRERLGQGYQRDTITERGAAWLWNEERIRMIDVTDAEDAARGAGHAYLRASPWVSSDILSTLLYDLTPEERGLTRTRDYPVWEFPPDYMEKLTERVGERYSQLHQEAAAQ